MFNWFRKQLEDKCEYEPSDYDCGDMACTAEQGFVAREDVLDIITAAENKYKVALVDLLSGKWVDSKLVQELLGLSFNECFALFDFSRTADWWSIVGETEEERARDGQKIVTKFRLKQPKVGLSLEEYNTIQQEFSALPGKYKQKNIASSKYCDVYKEGVLACKSVLSNHKPKEE